MVIVLIVSDWADLVILLKTYNKYINGTFKSWYYYIKSNAPNMIFLFHSQKYSLVKII